MKRLLTTGIVLVGLLAAWGCGKTEPSAQPTETTTPAAAEGEPRPAGRETVNPPVLPHVITDAEVGQKAVCPVMGTEVTVDKNTLSAEYKGKVYYFCCGGCPDEFKANPDKFAK